MKSSADTSYFSAICTEQCKGLCCDPWWGIISYPVVKNGGMSNLNAFRAEVIKGIKEREKRIIEGYVTKEAVPRPLFGHLERYNVSIREIKINGNSLALNVMAMFAFRCRYLSADKVCTIHPAVIGGEDIRPPHCGFMGSLNVRPGEKGYCRIIHAAESPSADGRGVDAAIEIEKDASERHYREGVSTIEMAADALIAQLKEYCTKHLPHLLPQEKPPVPGRNDPCYCGSGKKYKRCHG